MEHKYPTTPTGLRLAFTSRAPLGLIWNSSVASVNRAAAFASDSA